MHDLFGGGLCCSLFMSRTHFTLRFVKSQYKVPASTADKMHSIHVELGGEELECD